MDSESNPRVRGAFFRAIPQTIILQLHLKSVEFYIEIYFYNVLHLLNDAHIALLHRLQEKSFDIHRTSIGMNHNNILNCIFEYANIYIYINMIIVRVLSPRS